MDWNKSSCDSVCEELSSRTRYFFPMPGQIDLCPALAETALMAPAGIALRLHDAETRAALRQMTVVATSPALADPRVAESSRTGEVRFADLPPGIYTLTYSHGQKNWRVSATECVRVAAGETSTLVVAVVDDQEGGCPTGPAIIPLSGRVKTDTGVPISGARILARPRSSCSAEMANTDAQGRFQLHVAAANYEVTVSDLSTWEAHRRVAVPKAGTLDMDFVVPSAAIENERAFAKRAQSCQCRSGFAPSDTEWPDPVPVRPGQ
jgi:hypothetical protein